MLTEKEKSDLHTLLERLHKLSGEDTFSGLVLEMWEFLGIEEECDIMAFENALIETIKDFTRTQESDTLHTKRRMAKKRDLLLLMFGLLDGKGYYHTEPDENDRMVSVTADERIFRYVKQSDYKKLAPKRQKLDDESCIDAVYKAHRREINEKNHFFDFLIKRINGETDTRINGKTFQKYVQQYIDLPPKTVELSDGRKRIVLPQPSYTDTSQNGSGESYKQESVSSSIQNNFQSATEHKSPCPVLVEDVSNKDGDLTGETMEPENKLGEEITEPKQEQESEPDAAESTSTASLNDMNDEIGNSTTNGNESSDDVGGDEDNMGAQLLEPAHEQKAELETTEESATTLFPPGSENDNHYSREDDAEKRNNKICDGEATDEGGDDTGSTDKEFRTNRHSKKRLAVIALVLLLCIGGGIALVLYLPENKPKTNESEPDLRVLGDPFHAVNGKDMEKLANEAFSSIALYDDSGEYRTYDMCDLLQERIMNNPIFGDMVARGMLEAFSKGDYDYFSEVTPDIQEFVAATDAAMEEQENLEKRCMKKWLIKAHDVVYTTDEYKEYAGDICELLDYLFSSEIQNLRITSYWELDPDSHVMDARTVQRSERRTEPTLIFSYRTMNGTYRCIFGFLIEDGSFVISDPYNWGTDSFTE